MRTNGSKSLAATLKRCERWAEKKSWNDFGRSRTVSDQGLFRLLSGGCPEEPFRLPLAHLPDDLIPCSAQQGDHIGEAVTVEELGNGQALVDLLFERFQPSRALPGRTF